jgi:hypothetical protein
MKKSTITPKNLSGVAREAKALVALAFRNGPIEDIHAGKLCPTCTVTNTTFQTATFQSETGPEVPARLRGAARSLLFIQILAGNIVLRHLMRANLLLVIVTSVFYARHCVGLERVSFLDQLGHTLRIRTFDVGQSL